MFIVPKYGTSVYIREPLAKQSRARVVQVWLVMISQVYVRPWRMSWTAVNLLTLPMFIKSRYLLGSSFIHFLICERNDSYDMLLSTGVSW